MSDAERVDAGEEGDRGTTTRRRRISRWDRPPPPRDLRWGVNLVGRSFVVLGLLVLLFVAYLLWGTGIETARAQRSLESEFDELIAAGSPPSTIGTEPDSGVPGSPGPGSVEPTTAVPPTDAPPSTLRSGDPPSTGTRPGATASSPPGTTDPTTPAQPEVTAPPVDQDLPAFFAGDAVARLEIPRIGLDVIVVEGVDREDLKRGPGHYEQTPFPGQLGNAAIAGHRTTYGEPFADIDQLDDGDEIVVTTPAGSFLYLVDSLQIVEPADGYVVQTTDESVARITLTSCHPRWSASQRIVVSGELVGTRSAPVGIPGLATDPPDTIAGEDPTPSTATADDTTAESPATNATTLVSETRPDRTEPESTTGDEATTVLSPATPADGNGDGSGGDGSGDGASTGAGGGGGDPGEEDAFADSWFSDPGALVDVALWSAPLVLIAIGGYLISRRLRNLLVGTVIAAAPFFVVLYFVFQNVNRLLPAAF